MTDPFHINLSRGRRVAPIAGEILAEVEPKLKRMSVSDLVRCLKVQDGSGFVTNYIADSLYPVGNKMIIAEIASRSTTERKVLAGWPRDGDYLDTGSQGEGQTVDELLRELATPRPEKTRTEKDR